MGSKIKAVLVQSCRKNGSWNGLGTPLELKQLLLEGSWEGLGGSWRPRAKRSFGNRVLLKPLGAIFGLVFGPCLVRSLVRFFSSTNFDTKSGNYQVWYCIVYQKKPYAHKPRLMRIRAYALVIRNAYARLMREAYAGCLCTAYAQCLCED